MRSAVIGLGVIGSLHARIAEDKGCLVAVCDIDESKRSLYPDKKFFTDYKAMLLDVKPDVLHVATPHYLHAEMVKEALKRNINVICEKPLCISESEIDEILAAEEKSEGILGVCFQNRYVPHIKYLKEYLQEHKPISAYASVSWKRDEAYYAQAEWRGKKLTEGGGVLINQAIHTLDLLQWLLGEPKKITSTVTNLTHQKFNDVEDTATLIADGEVPFVLQATVSAYDDFPNRISVKTQDGFIEMIGEQIFVDGKIIDFTTGKKYNVKPVYGTGHDILIDDFYSCVKNKKRFWIDGREGAKALKIVLEAYKPV